MDMNPQSMIGRSGLPGTEGIVYDKVRSDAEKTMLDIVNECGAQKKFKQVAIDYDPAYPSTLTTEFEINPEGELTAQGTLLINNELLEDMYGVYRAYPEVIPAALRFGIEHELSHTTGGYSSTDKIVKKYVAREIRKNGRPSKAGIKMLARIEFRLNPECENEREYKANLQAMTSRLEEPGMTFEKLEDEVAAALWLLAEHKYNAGPYQNIGDVERSWSDYLEKKFPRLGDEFKEQIMEKIFGIDREYRRRCKEMAGREASPLSFGHTTGK